MNIGIIGLILILIGWIPQTIKAIREKSGMDLRFAIMYTTGCVLLTIYAVKINDWIFIILNGGAAILSGISLIYSLKNPKKKEKRIS